jgi:hypothetical protein
VSRTALPHLPGWHQTPQQKPIQDRLGQNPPNSKVFRDGCHLLHRGLLQPIFQTGPNLPSFAMVTEKARVRLQGWLATCTDQDPKSDPAMVETPGKVIVD